MVIPSEGTIKFKEETYFKKFEYRKHIGYMPQIGRYPDNMTIGQILEMIKEIRNLKNHLDEDLLHQFKLQNLFNKRMSTLVRRNNTKSKCYTCFFI
jgi:Cu-processing system ATP-binding protein